MLLVLAGADIIAMVLLLCGAYLPLHQRTDMAMAFVAVNLGVFAVSAVLANSASIGAGVGLGLFGVLSIIRLRSEEMSHREIAYYFTSLTLGLLGGLSTTPAMAIPMMAVIVLVVACVDYLSRLRDVVQRTLVLDHAVSNPLVLREQIEEILGEEILDVKVRRLDFINDSTLIDVRSVQRKKTDLSLRQRTQVPAMGGAS